jgi:hypothetical protein
MAQFVAASAGGGHGQIVLILAQGVGGGRLDSMEI